MQELAYMRRRAVEGRSTRSTSSRVVTSRSAPGTSTMLHHATCTKRHAPAPAPCTRAAHRQASYQQPTDNKSLDFVYYSDSEDEAVDGGILLLLLPS